MPIKFRCQHCRQFLGISRNKAGELVDCPTCGRTLRVPDLDGTLEPVPDPKLDLEDSSLTNALDALAMIGQDTPDGAEDDEPKAEFVAKPEPVKVIEIQAPPKPIVVDAPLPPQPVIPQSAQARPNASQQPGDQLAALAREEAGERHKPVLSSPKLNRSPSIFQMVFSRTGLCLIAIVAAVGFGSGYWVGGTGANSESGSSESDETKSEQPANSVKNPPPAGRKIAVTGQIMFKAADGRRLPDAGAHVLVFPEKRSGKATVAVAGFWANAAKTDFRISLAGLREMNGDAAVTDKDGKYEINLPETAGGYRVLIISHNHQRDDDETVSLADRNLLTEYLDRPDALLKQLSYKLDRVQYTGTAAETLNHSFE
jgi:hypothetical protein